MDEKDRSVKIREMFSSIAERYDFLNHLLSFGMDLHWRKRCALEISSIDRGRILDVATGTADLAIEIARYTKKDVKITGIDFSKEMLLIGKRKIEEMSLEKRISLVLSRGEALPFADNLFDGITIAFGIRNFPNMVHGLKEMNRVLKPRSPILILEFSKPVGYFSSIYRFYSKRILPAVGGIFSKKYAYQYLPDSVENFPSRQDFMEMMKMCGFCEISFIDMTFGIVTIFRGRKKVDS